ncbi:MAG: AraC family transcriptional regulator [Muribaculaceae bacterium]|nr:AraC family transcriptional regulator [Muribaculaceae bacterium]
MKATKALTKILAIISIFTIIIIAYILCYDLDYDTTKSLRLISLSALTIIGILGSIMLFTQKEKPKSKKIYATLIFLLGIAAFASLILIFIRGGLVPGNQRVASPFILIYGSVYGFLFMLYPIEVIRPGWLNIKRGIMLFSPIVIFLASTMLFIHLGWIQKSGYETFDNLTQNLLSLNFILRILILLYPIGCLMITLFFRKSYNHWIDNNYSSIQQFSINWLDYYIMGYFVIICSYIYVVTFGNSTSPIVHGFLFILFSLAFYTKVMNQSNPYPEDFFKDSITADCEDEETKDTASESRFISQLPAYKEIVDTFLIENENFRNKDLKLLDLTDVLPLNRSYLSRVFNVGYGVSFNEVVNKIRIEAAEAELRKDSKTSIADISELCGFSSQSVFSRTFLKYNGITPSTYRKENSIASN